MAIVHAATAAGIITLGDGRVAHLEGRDVRAIAAGGGVWWALSGTTVLRRGAGTSWDEVADIPDRPECLRPTEAGLFVGTDRAHLFKVEDHSAATVGGFEAAPGRNEWYTPWGGPPAVRSIASGDAAVYVNVHVGGILRSDDGGATWAPTIDIHSDVHEVIVHGGRLLAATAYGLATSADDGATWEIEDDGLHASYARAVAVAGDHVLLTASHGPRGGRGAVYRRPIDAVGPFEKVHTGLPEWFRNNIDSGCLAGDGADAVFGTAEGRVFLSRDSGGSWDELAGDLSAVHAVALGT
jgi:hypothetical protein